MKSKQVAVILDNVFENVGYIVQVSMCQTTTSVVNSTPSHNRTQFRILILETHLPPLRWRHNGCDSVSNHQPRECLLRRLIRRTSKKTSKLCVTGLCAGNSPETGELPAQMASNAENVSIWWRHHAVHINGSVNRVSIGSGNGRCQVIISWMMLECC